MRLAIIGANDLAVTLAYRFSRLDHEVRIASLRGPERVAGLAERTGATAAEVDEAARWSEVSFIAIPFDRALELPADWFAERIVVDTTDYVSGRDPPIAALDEGRTTSSELLAAHLAGSRLVKAFNTINLLPPGDTGPVSGDVATIAIPMAGDDPAAKAVVAGLIVDIGFAPVDIGTLADSWRLQPGMPVHGLVGDEREVRAVLAAVS